MKNFKKIICLGISVSTALSITACGDRGRGNNYEGKEILWIGNFDGAAGHKWLDALISEYEALHPNVKINVENKKEEFFITKLSSDMPYSENDLYFLDHVNWRDLVEDGLAENITDVVSEKIYDDEGNLPEEGKTATKSIIDMMMPEYASFMNYGTAENPDYYTVPWFYPISGIVYDADLFDKYNFYFDKNGDIGVKKSDPNVGPGPDGKYETTYDNGEPETWNDFLELIMRIKIRGLTPFTWSGQYIYQRQYFSTALQASYEGAADYILNYTFSGTDSELGEITEENAYKLLEQKGYLASCIAAKDIVSDSANYSQNAFNELTQSHTTAESEFVYSVESGGKRIAMFLESSYWEPEAYLTFDEMAEFNENYGYGKRNFAFMSMPKFKGVSGIEDTDNEKTTLFGDGSTKCVVINKASEQKELAKDFFRFIHTRHSNAVFTAKSNTFRPFTYAMTEEEYAMLTPFMKTVVDRVTDTENVEVVVGEKYSSVYVNKGIDYFNTSSKFGTKVYYELMGAYKSQGCSADELWAAMKNLYNASTWRV